ncbi:type IV pilin N-terminal domain-containing protein [Haloarcula sp. 1CSR25-25]|uniref:type IV pilin N-terminal domain-containing protein n=1 Tax=Haloarcula sp. 1CSR25-25 TaxID=2862545 RepID=UPI0028960E38|nr:type IV pilin N-terminal domain-containing protein [Haloarcula sp. 1CSR25-25]MDT3434522.1 type IV pilin N-terminal domain-containing protein [Haloarcula sp. 1CSR25-25]
MELKRFFNDDDAVSPVIGVILMVAITVILAAVIATFVLGLGDQVSNTAPQASFSTDYDATVDTNGQVKITHDGGDSIKASNLYIRGTEIGGSSSEITSSNTVWLGNGQASGSNSKVVAGDRVTVGVASDSFEINVVYQSANGDNSATLATASGPDA